MSFDQTTNSRLKYRPDVDGLRAVAVLSVLAMHLGTRVSGGFVGVDVFFVISGYLISATILAEMNAGKFSIVSFYERRIRRIFPAMLVMMAVVTLLVYFLFVPSEVYHYARSLLAAVFSGSNFLFWHDAGYFDAESKLKPLLHTWSLGVEEQFYILFPIFLVLVRRWFPARLRAAVWTITILSFIGACLLVRPYPIATFFFAPLRAWELLIGTIISQGYVPQIRGALARNLASATGLLTILAACFLYTENTVFPGFSALLPCVGAALIIAAGETGPSLVGRLLASKPIVFVGLISYSLYLWHWPIIVFQTTSSILFSSFTLNTRQKLLLALLSILIAFLSWRFIEQPFRKGRFRPSRNGVFLVNGLAVAVITAAALACIFTRGLPGRFPPEARAIAAYTEYDEKIPYHEGSCFLTDTALHFDASTCLAQHPGRPSLLLIGDSHAAQLAPGLRAAYPEADILQATGSGCYPRLVADTQAGSAHCRAIFPSLYHDFLPHHKVDLVVISARWSQIAFTRLPELIAYLKSLRLPVVIIGPTFEFDTAEPRVVALALRAHQPGQIPLHLSQEPAALDAQLFQLARDVLHVPYVSPMQDLCTLECPIYAAPGVPFLFDRDHLTAQASTDLATIIKARHQLAI